MLLTFCVPLGGLFGAFLSSEFIAKISRRYIITYLENLYFISTTLLFLLAYSSSYRISNCICFWGFYKELAQDFSAPWRHYWLNKQCLQNCLVYLVCFINYLSLLEYSLLVFYLSSSRKYFKMRLGLFIGSISLVFHWFYWQFKHLYTFSFFLFKLLNI